jgi:hypothetical protein
MEELRMLPMPKPKSGTGFEAQYLAESTDVSKHIN